MFLDLTQVSLGTAFIFLHSSNQATVVGSAPEISMTHLITKTVDRLPLCDMHAICSVVLDTIRPVAA